MKALLLLFTVVILMPFSQKAQEIIQLNAYYSSLDSKGKSTFITSDNTSYIAGEFSGEIVIGFNYYDAQQQKSIYFSKQLSNGSIPFLKSFHSSGDVFVSTIISKGNEVYIGGTYTDSLFIESDTLINNNFKGIYIAVFDTSGNFLHSMNPTVYSAELYDMSFTVLGDLLVTGEYFGTFDFDGVSLNSPFGFNMFLINYNVSTQSLNWVKSSSGSATNGKSVRSDGAGNIYITGSYGDNTTFDAFTLAAVSGDHNSYIAKYSETGVLSWVNTIVSPVQVHGLGLAVSLSGDVYATGEYEMNVDIPSIGILNNAGLMDVYVTKLNSTGNFIWAKSIQSTQQDQGIKIVLDSNDNPIILSNAGASINFYGTNLNTNGYKDPLILKLNKFDGSYIWHCRIPSAPPSGIVDAYSISINNNLISICGSNRTGIFYQNELLDSPNLDDTYWVFIQDTNNAEINVASLTNSSNNNFSIHPNPFNSSFQIHSSQQIHKIQMLDLNGKVVSISMPNSSIVEIAPELDPGMYYLILESNSITQISKIHKL